MEHEMESVLISEDNRKGDNSLVLPARENPGQSNLLSNKFRARKYINESKSQYIMAMRG